MLKKVLIVLGVVILLLMIGGGVMIYRLNNMAYKFKSDLAKVSNLDLSTVKDGVYNGSYGDFVVSVNLEVTVKKHKITQIVIKDQSCGKGYDARGTIDRIIKAQSPKVDTITGASSSSRSIMLAVDRALRK